MEKLKAPKQPKVKLPKTAKIKSPKVTKSRKIHLPKFHLPKLRLPKIKLPTKKFWLSKKFLISTGLVVCIATAGIMLFKNVGRTTTSFYDIAVKNIAEVRYSMKSGERDNITMQFSTGIRESTYGRNGIATQSTPFAIVNVTGDEKLMKYKQIEGTIKIADEIYDIMLLQNPYKNENFAYDIVNQLRTPINATDPVEITLFLNDTTSKTVALTDIFTEDDITWDGALKIASETVGAQLANQKFETYVTILDKYAKLGGAYWFIEFVSQNGQNLACVVAPDGSIIC